MNNAPSQPYFNFCTCINVKAKVPSRHNFLKMSCTMSWMVASSPLYCHGAFSTAVRSSGEEFLRISSRSKCCHGKLTSWYFLACRLGHSRARDRSLCKHKILIFAFILYLPLSIFSKNKDLSCSRKLQI